MQSVTAKDCHLDFAGGAQQRTSRRMFLYQPESGIPLCCRSRAVLAASVCGLPISHIPPNTINHIYPNISITFPPSVLNTTTAAINSHRTRLHAGTALCTITNIRRPVCREPVGNRGGDWRRKLFRIFIAQPNPAVLPSPISFLVTRLAAVRCHDDACFDLGLRMSWSVILEADHAFLSGVRALS